ncbi:hypothetical protein QF002_004999 [Paraburkholderia youngii]
MSAPRTLRANALFVWLLPLSLGAVAVVSVAGLLLWAHTLDAIVSAMIEVNAFKRLNDFIFRSPYFRLDGIELDLSIREFAFHVKATN